MATFVPGAFNCASGSKVSSCKPGAKAPQGAEGALSLARVPNTGAEGARALKGPIWGPLFRGPFLGPKGPVTGPFLRSIKNSPNL